MISYYGYVISKCSLVDIYEYISVFVMHGYVINIAHVWIIGYIINTALAETAPSKYTCPYYQYCSCMYGYVISISHEWIYYKYWICV